MELLLKDFLGKRSFVVVANGHPQGLFGKDAARNNNGTQDTSH